MATVVKISVPSGFSNYGLVPVQSLENTLEHIVFMIMFAHTRMHLDGFQFRLTCAAHAVIFHTFCV